MVRIVTPEQLAQNFRKAAKDFERMPLRTINQITMAGQRFARRIAPVHTGNLKEGIRRTKAIKKRDMTEGSIISSVPKSFPYHFWVNEEPGFQTVKLPTVSFGGKFPTRKYRQTHKTERPMRYAETRHTGMPGYFTKTAELLQKNVGKKFNVEVKRVMDKNFG